MARRRTSRDKAEADAATPIRTPHLMAQISRAAADDATFLADTGTATAWTARRLRVHPGRRYTLCGGLAAMAFAFPGAIGAQLACPDRRVIAICGDAAFNVPMGEYVTAPQSPH